MTSPPTLLQLAGITLSAPPASGSALIIIDAQLEYVRGSLPLPGVMAALTALSVALERARAEGVPVVHVVHHGKPGSAQFDPRGEMVTIAPEVAPLPSECVVTKHYPSAFSGTELEAMLRSLKVTSPVFGGFMTHLCISSSVRAAMELGFQSRVIADGCATRSLPDGQGGVIDAEVVHQVHLAALADRFAGMVKASELWSSHSR